MHPIKLLPFPTIVHLRSAKIQNFLNVSTWMPHVVHVRAKDVSSLPGVNAFVSALLDRYRLSVACEVHKRDAILKSVTLPSVTLTNHPLSWEENPPEPLTSWQIRFITCNLDWEVESELGFSPKEDPDHVCPHGSVRHHHKTKPSIKKDDLEGKGMLFRFMDGLSNFG